MPTAGTRHRRQQVTWLLLFVLLGAAAWALFALLDPAPGAGVRDVAVPGGVLRVDGVSREEATHLPTVMPGMTHQTVREGHNLVRIDATLGASTDAIAYEPGQFRVSGAAFGPVEPYRAVAGPGRLFRGMSAPLLLVYEVPHDAGELRLSYAGVDVALGPADGRIAHEDHDHDDEHE